FRIRFKYFLSFVLYIGSLTTVCYFSKMLPLPWSTVFLLLFVVSVFLSFLTGFIKLDNPLKLVGILNKK
ncbi:MAG: hypothetical protein PHT69_16865, partial [Bacteroidales bacterium]|nr:hypothetical protein [Bacteroidales bacterium]